jgi:predicted alternative tryptophan synthase beta-subunit
MTMRGDGQSHEVFNKSEKLKRSKEEFMLREQKRKEQEFEDSMKGDESNFSDYTYKTVHTLWKEKLKRKREEEQRKKYLLQQKKQIRGLTKIAEERKEQYQERSKELTERATEIGAPKEVKRVPYWEKKKKVPAKKELKIEGAQNQHKQLYQKLSKELYTRLSSSKQLRSSSS